ncbi:hypothetical protein [Halioxenophilus aromaticivorans]
MLRVSQMWLGLVRSLSDEQLHSQTSPQNRTELTEQSFDQTLAHYQAVNEHLGQLWREQGQHAFLHHLSASFGYQPIFFGNLIQF